MLDYFYGSQAEQFSFYRVPKVLFTDDRFRSISAEAKVLYGILLDRMSLSQKNGWFDDADRVYIFYHGNHGAIGCAVQKPQSCSVSWKKAASKAQTQGLGKPNLIYVKNFITGAESKIQNVKIKFWTMKITNQELKIKV
jgi:hypothetical protein